MHTARTRGCNLARHQIETYKPAMFTRPIYSERSIVCRAAAAAGVSQLTPRQRRVEAKRKLKEAKRAQQQQQQQQQGNQPQSPQQRRQQQQASLPPSQSSRRRHSPANSGPQQQQQQNEAGLPPDMVQLLEYLGQSAKASRSFTLQQLQAAQPAAAAAASKLWAARGAMTQQQLADLAWCLAHFDLTLQTRRFGWDMQQQAPHTAAPWLAPVPAAGAAAAAAAAGLQSPHPAPHAVEAAQQVQQLSAACHAAMGTPFRVYPGLFPSLQLDLLMEEVELRQDFIYLEGGTRQVPEARLTGWQSDIGATFCYSGKEMQPQGRLTPLVAQVRDRLAALTGEHYDSVLVNYYPDGKCGMRFHVDPLYKTWTPNTAVVSIGHTRTFVFRAMEDHSRRWVYPVANGDLVVMFGDCQEVLQHAIRVEREAGDAGPRMSLVYKQNIQAVQHLQSPEKR